MFSMSLFVGLSFVLASISRYTFWPGWLLLEQTITSTFQAKQALLRSIGRLLADPKGLMLWVLCEFVWTWSSWLSFCSSRIFSLITVIFCTIFFSIQLAPSNSENSPKIPLCKQPNRGRFGEVDQGVYIHADLKNLSYGLLHGRLI